MRNYIDPKINATAELLHSLLGTEVWVYCILTTEDQRGYARVLDEYEDGSFIFNLIPTDDKNIGGRSYEQLVDDFEYLWEDGASWIRIPDPSDTITTQEILALYGYTNEAELHNTSSHKFDRFAGNDIWVHVERVSQTDTARSSFIKVLSISGHTMRYYEIDDNGIERYQYGSFYAANWWVHDTLDALNNRGSGYISNVSDWDITTPIEVYSTDELKEIFLPGIEEDE